MEDLDHTPLNMASGGVSTDKEIKNTLTPSPTDIQNRNVLFHLVNTVTSTRHIFLFDLILYVPSTIFQLNRDRSTWVEPVLS